MLKWKVYLFLESLAQLKFRFLANNSGFAWYLLFQLIVLLKPDFNCGNNFTLTWVEKVTIQT